MVRVAVVGLGKMGMSHLSMVRALPDVEVVGVVDSLGYLLGVLNKYTGVSTFSSVDELLTATTPDAVIVATPSRSHFPIVKQLLEAGVAVFCEKPFTLRSDQGEELVHLAKERRLVTQVGYHNRFVGAFQEVKKLVECGAIGEVTHGLAEAYGPVVLKRQGATWRSRSTEGGGSLYDYAAHPINLVHWFLGEPEGVGGTVLNSVFSAEIDDEVCSTIYFPRHRSVSLSVNWSDESVRKMTTRMTLWGTGGRIFADRQEVQVYLREDSPIPDGYQVGWNVRYTTELTEPVDFYLRGEEYTAQLSHFVRRVREKDLEGTNTFESAVVTDRVIEKMMEDAASGPSVLLAANAAEGQAPRRQEVRRSRTALSSMARRLTSLIPGRKMRK